MAGGRPSKLTKDVKKSLIQNIKIGAPYEIACTAAGITYQTFRNWMKKGEEAKSGEFFDFFEEITRANAAAAVRLLTHLQQGINDGNMQPAQWILERRFKEHFAPKQQLEHIGADGGPIKLKLTWTDVPADPSHASSDRQKGGD